MHLDLHVGPFVLHRMGSTGWIDRETGAGGSLHGCTCHDLSTKNLRDKKDDAVVANWNAFQTTLVCVDGSGDQGRGASFGTEDAWNAQCVPRATSNHCEVAAVQTPRIPNGALRSCFDRARFATGGRRTMAKRCHPRALACLGMP